MLVVAGDKELRIERVVGQQKATNFNEKLWRPPRSGKGKAGSKGEQSGDGPSAPVCMDIDADYEARNTAPTNPDGAAAMAVDGTEASTNARSGKQGRGGKDSWEEKECGGQGHCFFNCMAAGFILKTSSCTSDQIAPSLEVRAGDSAAALPPM